MRKLNSFLFYSCLGISFLAAFLSFSPQALAQPFGSTACGVNPVNGQVNYCTNCDTSSGSVSCTGSQTNCTQYGPYNLDGSQTGYPIGYCIDSCLCSSVVLSGNQLGACSGTACQYTSSSCQVTQGSQYLNTVDPCVTAIPTATPTPTGTGSTPTPTGTGSTPTPTPSTPDFSIQIFPFSQSVAQGNGASYTVQILSLNGYTGTINLSVAGCPPAPATCSVTPSTVTLLGGATAGLYVKSDITTPPISYTLFVVGTDGTLTHSASTIFDVIPPAVTITADFVNPNSGGSQVNQTQAFDQQYSDTLGSTDISQVWTTLEDSAVPGPGQSGNTNNNACFVQWQRGTNSFYLLDTSGTTWSAGGVAGSGAIISNAYCSIDPSLSYVTDNGNHLAVHLVYSFFTPFIGNKNFYMYANNPFGGNSGWQLRGNWNVLAAGSAPAINLNPTNFSFSGVSGGATPPGKILNISDIMAGTALNWTITTDMPWCHVTPTSGTTPFGTTTAVTVTVDAPSNVGAFTQANGTGCTVTVSDPAASNNPQQAFVDYTVVPNNVGCTGSSCGGGGGPNGGGPGSPVTAAPTAASACPATGVVVSWQAATGATSYNVYSNTTNSTSTATEIASNITALTYTDNSASFGFSYYYWVQAANGALVSPNFVGADTNAAGGVSPNACGAPTPTPTPTTPTNPGGNNNKTSGGSVGCSNIQLTWTDTAGDETGFYVYKTLTNTSPTLGGSSSPNYIGTVPVAGVTAFNFTYTPIPSGSINYYWVTAYNAAGESPVLAFGSLADSSGACANGINFSDSDKDILAINNTTINYSGNGGAPSPCNSMTDPLPANTSLNQNDILTFELNVCNDLGTATATAIDITDTMVNLQQPSSGWNIMYTYNGVTTSLSPASTKGTAPNQTIVVYIPGFVAAGSFGVLTFQAQLAAPSGFVGTTNRFQNKFTIATDAPGLGSATINRNTPLLPFYTGNNIPTINEIP